MKQDRVYILLSIAIPGVLVAVSVYLRLDPYGNMFGFMLVAMILAAVLPYGTRAWMRNREKAMIDQELLPFLSDLGSFTKSGKDLMTSIIMSTERRTGPLKRRLSRLEESVKLGMSPSDALNRLSENMPTPLSKDVFLIIYRLMLFGGNAPEVIDSLRNNLTDLNTVEMEKKSIMRNYASIIYVSFILLLLINVILFRYFFLKIAAQPVASSPFGAASLNLVAIKSIIFQLSLIEGTISGVIAGKIGEGSSAAGVKHIIAMLIIALAFYYLL